ncbi:hypothetical protein [Photobacterium sp. GSS17]|uniref:hypothetical protein n=1 Tax=Photobacterium sp. GSS17 TaxID=3020715 RepID=UPI002360CE54|nr:hypothetical protein [Photobacterium sp. GSS17]
MSKQIDSQDFILRFWKNLELQIKTTRIQLKIAHRNDTAIDKFHLDELFALYQQLGSRISAYMSSSCPDFESKEQRWRREGRREAALLLMEKLSAESIEHTELVGWSSIADTGDYSGHWNEQAVFQFFNADITESYLEAQLAAAMKTKSAYMDAKFIEGMLRTIIEDYRHDLSTNGMTQLDKAAFYLGIHSKPPQETQ